nr:MAG TPA: hypothetical protein [Caudoviricetes sp.]
MNFKLHVIYFPCDRNRAAWQLEAVPAKGRPQRPVQLC